MMPLYTEKFPGKRKAMQKDQRVAVVGIIHRQRGFILEEGKARSRLAYRVVGLVLALLLGIYFIYQIPQLVLLFLLTILFAIVLSGPVNYLARMGLPRGVGVLLALASLGLVLWLASRIVTPVIGIQAEQFINDFPTLLAQVQDLVWSSQSTFGLGTGSDLDSQSLLQTGQDYLSSHVSSAVSVGRSLVEAVSLGVVGFILTIYLVIQPAQLVNGFSRSFRQDKESEFAGCSAKCTTPSRSG